jgi:hypothetical protein
MRDRAFCAVFRPSILLVQMGLILSAAGCSPEGNAGTENRPPATRQLKHIEELQKKSAPTGKTADKAR